ncbi:hypothetical protein HC891_12020 [Candidatus Gracilibacteria bacterium]|nr:hypothetical protein [Candidatus Gracilibacteria bacterium]
MTSTHYPFGLASYSLPCSCGFAHRDGRPALAGRSMPGADRVGAAAPPTWRRDAADEFLARL